jgi:hypothetical protein
MYILVHLTKKGERAVGSLKLFLSRRAPALGFFPESGFIGASSLPLLMVT